MTKPANLRMESQLQPVLLRSDRGGIVTLTLNRPAARNALSEELIDALYGEFGRIAETPTARVVVVAANGPAFCAGHDLREIRAHPGRASYESLFAKCSRLMAAITALPQPVIARVHGIATAAGCQLVASCDLAVAADTAKFATPGVDIGLFCSTPMVPISRAMPRKKTMEMLMTGAPIDAATAERFALVNTVVPQDALDTAVDAMARTLLSKSPSVLALGKAAFYRQLEMGLSDAYDHAGKVMVENMLMPDAEEGIGAFLEKRPPVWRGE